MYIHVYVRIETITSYYLSFLCFCNLDIVYYINYVHVSILWMVNGMNETLKSKKHGKSRIIIERSPILIVMYKIMETELGT